MFDYRYHALSLAAVLIALALGVLLGVAIGDSNLVSSAKSGAVRSLQSDLNSANNRIATLEDEQRAATTVQNDFYELAVNNQLFARKVGLVFLGSSSQHVDGLVRSAVTEAGGEISNVITVIQPLNFAAISQRAAGTQYTALAENPQPAGLAKRFGVRIGDQIVKGGKLISHVQSSLLSSFDGQFGELQGLVVMRQQPEGSSSEAQQATSEFEAGLVAGADAAGATTVGVELSSTEPSQIPWYKSQKLASVDDLDKLSGRAALALALAGAHGSWGTKSTADGPLPQPVGDTTQP
jgi:Copper transport outer membrane protein, MctB